MPPGVCSISGRRPARTLPRDSAIGTTRVIRARHDCCNSRSSSTADTLSSRALEQELTERRAAASEAALSLNADGAIAAVCGDLGLDGETAAMLFTISRVPGFVAHAIEEQRRQKAMRLIDPTKHHYDGPKPRRFPDAPL